MERGLRSKAKIYDEFIDEEFIDEEFINEVNKLFPLQIEESRERSGYDCWGMPEYENVYYLKTNDNKIISTSTTPPSKKIIKQINELVL